MGFATIPNDISEDIKSMNEQKPRGFGSIKADCRNPPYQSSKQYPVNYYH